MNVNETQDFLLRFGSELARRLTAADRPGLCSPSAREDAQAIIDAARLLEQREAIIDEFVTVTRQIGRMPGSAHQAMLLFTVIDKFGLP